VLGNVLVENKVTYIPCCKVIKIKFDDEFNFEYFTTHLDELIVEFK